MQSRRLKALVVLVASGALLGFLFAAVSTYDFIQHLDRQMHGVHCSFIPGLGDADISGTSGCAATLMSPYSSVLRSHFWGGIPISLPAMSAFAFIGFLLAEVVLSRRITSKRGTAMLALATAVPALASVVMGSISLAVLDTVCRICAGIYISSALCLAGGIGLWLHARTHARTDALGRSVATEPDTRFVIRGAAIGAACVALPLITYMVMVPDHQRYIGTCGFLAEPEDTYGVFLPLDDLPGQTPAIEVLDPLCPACRTFEERLEMSELNRKLTRQVVLFPLDNTCNWMVDSALHPGACTISEAMLCAPRRAPDILDWSYARQERIREAAAADPKAAAVMVSEAFPEIKDCLGSAAVRSKLNKSLRWVVRNQLPVLTPQLYVNNQKLCDEDTDLGMEFALSRMLQNARQAGGAQ